MPAAPSGLLGFPVGTARRRRAAEKDPEFGGGSPLGRDPGIQRHLDCRVVHAVRCAARSGADQRSAFPCQRRHLDCWGSRSAQPAAGGRREGPRVRGWPASRPGPRHSASSGLLRGTRRSPRCAGRCRPPPGELARGRRSRACALLRLVAWAPEVGGAGRHAGSGGPRNGVTPPAKTAGTAWERRPLVGTRGSAKPAPMTVRRTDVSGAPAAQSGLCCSLRFAQRCRPEVGVPLLACRLCSIRTAPLAPLRGAVPTRGRRSRACASLVLNRDCAARPAARGDTA